MDAHALEDAFARAYREGLGTDARIDMAEAAPGDAAGSDPASVDADAPDATSIGTEAVRAFAQSGQAPAVVERLRRDYGVAAGDLADDTALLYIVAWETANQTRLDAAHVRYVLEDARRTLRTDPGARALDPAARAERARTFALLAAFWRSREDALRSAGDRAGLRALGDAVNADFLARTGGASDMRRKVVGVDGFSDRTRP